MWEGRREQARLWEDTATLPRKGWNWSVSLQKDKGGAQDKRGQAERSRAWSAEGDKAQRDLFVTMTQREQREKLEQNSSWKCTGAGKEMRDKAGIWNSIYILRGKKNLHKSGQTLD